MTCAFIICHCQYIVVDQFWSSFVPVDEGGWIHPIPDMTIFTPFHHFDRLRAFSFFKPIFLISSSTWFFQVFLGHPLLLQSLPPWNTMPSLKHHIILLPPQYMSVPAHTICFCQLIILLFLSVAQKDHSLIQSTLMGALGRYNTLLAPV